MTPTYPTAPGAAGQRIDGHPPPSLESEEIVIENGVVEISGSRHPQCTLDDVAVIPSPELIPAIDPVPEKLVDAWDTVKDDPKSANTSRELDTVGVCSPPRLLFRSNLILAYR